MDDVAAWLADLGFGHLSTAFAENGIDFDILAELSNEDLKELGVAKLGDRKRLLAAVAKLNPTSDATGASASRDTAQGRIDRHQAERRQLTVMFVDIVGSTEMSSRLDPEEMREIILLFQNVVAGAIARFDGQVAKFMGDGALCYFGWPSAHEDDAERAVRAALDILASIRSPAAQRHEELTVRVGIATGLVVVGDLIGEGASQEEAVVGATPNLAARLQSIAEPGWIVVGETTRRLLGGAFDVTVLGEQRLKGFSTKTRAFRVDGARSYETRFEARSSAGMADLVGRDAELDQVLAKWRLAQSGSGQLVLVQGEAGIGKSRTLRALVDAIANQPHTRISYQCSPHHAGSSLYPVIQQLKFAADFEDGDIEDVRLDKLEAILVNAEPALAAALLNLPFEHRYGPLTLSAQERRVKTLEMCADELVALSHLRPVLFVLEDAHWIDSSTLQLLDLCLKRIAGEKVLMVITARPGFKHDFGAHAFVTSLKLDRLRADQARAMIERATDGGALPDKVVEDIIAKSDGVPLFLEELVKAVLETGDLRQSDGASETAGSIARLAVPESLQDSLIARLDRLGPVKEVAQIAACVGREFDFRLLEAVSPFQGETLGLALDKLCSAELIFRRSGKSGGEYLFKHALLRDAAHDTLLRSRRRILHAEIADALKALFPQVVETTPELIGHHLIEADRKEEAISWLQRAGARAAERSAYAEAIAHLEKGLKLIEDLPASRERDRVELDLQITLGPALMIYRGVGRPEVEAAYLRARTLAEATGDTNSLFKAQFGLWQRRHVSGDVAAAKQIADELIASHEHSSDSGQRLQAHHTNWTSSLFSGEHAAAVRHSGCGLDIYDRDEHRTHKFIYAAHDPAACGHTFNAISNWFLGNVDSGLEQVERAVALGAELKHPVSYAIALLFAGVYHQFRRDLAEASHHAELGAALCHEYKIASWGAAIATLRGYISFERGDPDAEREIQDGMDAWRATGNTLFWPLFHTFKAQTLLKQQRATEGLALIEAALRHVELNGEHWLDAELHRFTGELLLASPSSSKEDAEAAFRSALEIARQQSARSLELRAATSLARYQGQSGQRDEAVRLLEPVIMSINGGSDTADLSDAASLLRALR